MRGNPDRHENLSYATARPGLRFAASPLFVKAFIATFAFVVMSFVVWLLATRLPPSISLGLFATSTVFSALGFSALIFSRLLVSTRQDANPLTSEDWRGLTPERREKPAKELEYMTDTLKAVANRLAMTEEILSKEESRSRALLENAVDAIVSTDTNGMIVSANAATERLFGYKIGDLIGKNVRILAGGIDRLHHDAYIKNYLETGEKRIIGRPREVLGQRANGTTFPVDLSVARMSSEGDVLFIGIMRDLTQRVALEDQLRQAQKMEAVGQLTGGIAHDFNNLLAVIAGNLEMLRQDIRAQTPFDREELVELCTESLQAVGRSAELTQGLLAFSRKQTLKAETFDVNETLDRMETLLRRTLGESIDLKITRKEKGWQVKADQAQLESAIVNLAVNANDAMGNVGVLTIETRDVRLGEHYAATHDEVEAGDYIQIAVSDNGPGMSEDVLAHALEPFFTTKDVGEGTGLGLAMIYGYAKQSGGHLSLYSEKDVGTTVKLYLPRSRENSRDTAQPAQAAGPVEGTETIMVVEDDEALRRTVTRILKRNGYTVLVAHDGPSALEMLRDNDHIDLLLTDVILPGGITGPDLAIAAEEMYGTIKVLLMSGYTREAIMHRGDINEDVKLIHKPFSPQELGLALRDILGDIPGEG